MKLMIPGNKGKKASMKNALSKNALLKDASSQVALSQHEPKLFTLPATPLPTALFPAVLLAALCLASPWTIAQGQPGGAAAIAVAMPDGSPGIGFDDLGFAAKIGKVLVPAGRTGNLDLLDPVTHKVIPLGGFSAQPSWSGGHDFGVTSADEGAGFLFATDRTSKKIAILDEKRQKIIAWQDLGGSPDYVRFVKATREVWVTEPDSERIEIFSLATASPPRLRAKAVLPIPGGPESLVIDATRKRAYTHLWKAATVAIDLTSHQVISKWPNHCLGSRGIALDEKRGRLFAGCAEGKAVVLDLDQGGKIVSELKAGSGIDVISYNPALSHLYLPGAKSATLTIIQVGPKGQLSRLRTFKTAEHAHCVTSDDKNGIWVCDPKAGALLYFQDTSK